MYSVLPKHFHNIRLAYPKTELVLNDHNQLIAVGILRIFLSHGTNNIKSFDEEDTLDTIYVASVSEPNKYELLDRGAAEPNNEAKLS